MKETIKIKGMHCKSCTEKVESKLKMLKGINTATADLLTDNVTVEFDDKAISLDQIKSELDLIGYECCNAKIEKADEAKTANTVETAMPIINEKRKKTLMQGIAFGLVPHIGCIAFLVGSVLGVTLLTDIFKPLLLNSYFFYGLIGLSLAFATISSAYYLKKNGLLSSAGAAKKWKYLSTMYGSTIGVNLILFLFIFPLVANVSLASPVTSYATDGQSILKLSVDIPCSGHAPLIIGEIKKVSGIVNVEFSNPNYFTVSYDPTKTSASSIEAIDIFKTYKATVISTTDSRVSTNLAAATTTSLAASVSSGVIINNNVQEVHMSVDASGYSPNSFVLKKGVPVKWFVDVKQLTGCNSQLIASDYGINAKLSQGMNTFEFTPSSDGTFTFHCAMGMIKGSFIVTDNGVASQQQVQAASGGGCGCSSR